MCPKERSFCVGSITQKSMILFWVPLTLVKYIQPHSKGTDASDRLVGTFLPLPQIDGNDPTGTAELSLVLNEAEGMNETIARECLRVLLAELLFRQYLKERQVFVRTVRKELR